MRIGRLNIAHSGNPPYVPNWAIQKGNIGIAGWHFVLLSKETVAEIKEIARIWKG